MTGWKCFTFPFMVKVTWSVHELEEMHVGLSNMTKFNVSVNDMASKLVKSTEFEQITERIRYFSTNCDEMSWT